MGTAQSSKRAAASDEVHIGAVAHQGHSSHARDGTTRVEDDFETHRRVAAAVGASSPVIEENLHVGSNEVPESVNQMLQASLGDEPGLNLTSMRHDSNASELRRPGEKGANKLPTVFRWEHGGDEVYLAGTFSNWKRIPMVRSRDNFFTICELAEGEHEYKFVVDGAWRCDDKVETKSTNEQGAVNNVIRVKNSDFEVFEALQCDLQSNTANTSTAAQKDAARKTGESESSASSSARLQSNSNVTGVYTQEMPSRRSLEFEPPPPALPPHLLQVLLNKDTAANYDPNLLPEPNHVMLNHLYALSIREGVMVLSATHRYRKKYVTTLLYKPIQ